MVGSTGVSLALMVRCAAQRRLEPREAMRAIRSFEAALRAAPQDEGVLK
jgi:hypothetical protein